MKISDYFGISLGNGFGELLENTVPLISTCLFWTLNFVAFLSVFSSTSGVIDRVHWTRQLIQLCLPLSARALEKARAQLQGEVTDLRTKALEEQKKREQQDALVRRLQKRVLLLTKVWLPLDAASVVRVGVSAPHFSWLLGGWCTLKGRVHHIWYLHLSVCRVGL